MFPSTFYFENFKHKTNMEEFYCEQLYIHYDYTITILIYMLYHIFIIYWSLYSNYISWCILYYASTRETIAG